MTHGMLGRLQDWYPEQGLTFGPTPADFRAVAD